MCPQKGRNIFVTCITRGRVTWVDEKKSFRGGRTSTNDNLVVTKNVPMVHRNSLLNCFRRILYVWQINDWKSIQFSVNKSIICTQFVVSKYIIKIVAPTSEFERFSHRLWYYFGRNASFSYRKKLQNGQRLCIKHAFWGLFSRKRFCPKL